MNTACRVCRSPSIVAVGTVEYIAGLPCDIFDCHSCGCRWSRHDPSVHALMHQTAAISYYADYRALLDASRRCFSAGDREQLERVLSAVPKYKYVVERLRLLGPGARVLEWGCSRGYLTAAALLAGRAALGVDVSADAIADARAAFGDHFALTNSPRIESQGPYDAIYHVGLIGCVPDPLGLTRRLLSLLAPGGRLFFNAPNRDAMFQRGQLWMDSAPPPELITLFPEGFWKREFGDVVFVTEAAVPTAPPESTVKTLTRWCGPVWRPPLPRVIQPHSAYRWQQPVPGVLWSRFSALAAKVSAVTGAKLGSWPEEFGLYVEMTGV